MTRQKKIKKISSISMILAAIAVSVYYIASALISPHLILEEGGLGKHDFLKVRAWPEGDAFHLGDVINYFVEIRYNPQKIEEIDKDSIDLAFEPFGIRNQKEKESRIDSYNKVYLREYEIQLLDGVSDRLYEFPESAVRYKLKDSVWTSRKIILQPIPVGSRFPSGAVLGLKPAEGLVANASNQIISLILIILGVFCGLIAGAKIFKAIRRRRVEAADSKKRLEGIEDIFGAYQRLLQKKDSPKAVLHRAYQVLRILLIRKEGKDQIDLSDLLFHVPPQIGYSVCKFVLDFSCKAYNKEELGQEELDEALAELKKIFDFYTGARKGEA